jgi:hypothetical protein
MMKPYPPRGWSHNATDGLLIDIDGDRATVDAQFMVFSILGDAKPASGWPAGAVGAMGAITPIESGYYTQTLVRVDGQWLIESLQIRHNLPMAVYRRYGGPEVLEYTDVPDPKPSENNVLCASGRPRLPPRGSPCAPPCATASGPDRSP